MKNNLCNYICFTRPVFNMFIRYLVWLPEIQQGIALLWMWICGCNPKIILRLLYRLCWGGQSMSLVDTALFMCIICLAITHAVVVVGFTSV